jgi:hypothetical protein
MLMLVYVIHFIRARVENAFLDFFYPFQAFIAYHTQDPSHMIGSF